MKKILILFFFLLSINLFAHRVDVFPYIENGEIVVEGYFSDGTPTKNAKVEIFNEKGNKIKEGKTDEKGVFSFPVPESASRLKIVLEASMGHRAETTFTVEQAGKEVKKTKSEDKKGEIKKVKKEKNRIEKIDSVELERVVEESIKPLIKMMEEERRRTRISDVIGGIGYILGIFGIIALLYKKK